jgi:hypothetical protein
VTIVIDIIHVLEYLWKAAWSFYAEGDPAAQAWVHEKALAVLHGKAPIVAAAIRRKATCLALTKERRKGADVCAHYLLSKNASRGGWNRPFPWRISTVGVGLSAQVAVQVGSPGQVVLGLVGRPLPWIVWGASPTETHLELRNTGNGLGAAPLE